MAKKLAERITAHWWSDTFLANNVCLNRSYSHHAINIQTLSDELKTSIFDELDDQVGAIPFEEF